MTYLDGGRERLLAYIRHAMDDGIPKAALWWAIYSELSTPHQQDVAFEDICAVAKVTPSDFMGFVVAAGMKHESNTADLVASSFQPKLVETMARSAMRISGPGKEIAAKDRHLLLQSKGSIPMPRNAVMSVTVNANSNASASAKAAAAASSDHSIPSFMDDVGTLQASKERVQRVIAGQAVEDEGDGTA